MNIQNWVHKNCRFAAWPKETNYRNLAELELLLEEYGHDELQNMIAKLQEEKMANPLQPGQRVLVKQRGQNLPGTFVRLDSGGIEDWAIVKIDKPDGTQSAGNSFNPDNITPMPQQLP